MSSIATHQSVFATKTEGGYCFECGERFIAGVLLVMTGPLLLAIWLMILMLSRRAPLIAHRRVGRHGLDLWVLKFRTMWDRSAGQRKSPLFEVEHIDDDAGPGMKRRNDSRVCS